MAYQMAHTPVTFNDLEGHLQVAWLSNAISRLFSTAQHFYKISIDVMLAWPLSVS